MSDAKRIARKVLWRHPKPASTFLEDFRIYLNKRHSLSLQTYDEIFEYSVSRYPDFWDDVFRYSEIIHTGSYRQVIDVTAKMTSIPGWFQGVKLNLAENLLFGAGKDASKIAVTCIREGNTEVRDVSWGELRAQVGRFASALDVAGLRQGDRVAVIASNSLNTLLIFIAVAALGGIFTSMSTDMGTKAILDRLLQVKPRIVFMDDFAIYGGKVTTLKPKAIKVADTLNNTAEFQHFISLPRYPEECDISDIIQSQTLSSFLTKACTTKLEFIQLPFNAPYLIAYSSGTTGQPKCIVHGVGGIILSQKKELLLHYNVGPQSSQLVFTTTSWAMYNKSVTSLLNGAHIVTYDGSPFFPDATVLMKIAEEQELTHLGISPRYLEELERRGVVPREIADLKKLEMVNCTGAALLPQQYSWFYDQAFHPHTQLANSAGGTDTACCFAVQNAFGPVYAGELQRPALGMSIEIFEQIDEDKPVTGKPVEIGQSGELVITKPFPTMPVMFWGDNAEERYQSAYFSKFKDVWCQGDFIKIHPDTGGVEFLGRSDGVLNPSGIRFGSAEIYGVIEQIPIIADSICVGQRRPQDSHERVFLFVLMKPGSSFNDDLVQDIKQSVRRHLSARHVPAFIFECFEIPTTINQKKVELPVKQIISGKKIAPSSTLANPESLKFFEQFAFVEAAQKDAKTDALHPLFISSKL